MIPAAGQSTRYGLSRPKFLLQHPNKGTMLSAAISGLGDLSKHGISLIRVVSLSEFFEDLSAEKLRAELQQTYKVPVEFDLLESPTGSMVETLILSLSKMDTDSPILIKDCDNLVDLGEVSVIEDKNFICYADLRNFPQIVAHNKSFLTFGTGNELDGIVEKKIIGSFINVGCIKFESASDFLAAAATLKLGRETYVSDVIRVMLGQNFTFQGIEVSQYEDWGTFEEWKKYTHTYATLFVDVDGVIVYNENPIGKVLDWNSFRPISENIKYLLELSLNGRTQIIFTTARGAEYKNLLEENLKNYGFINFIILTDMFHAKRYLINDFAPTNPYPSAISINILRNANNLRDYIP